MHNKKNLLSNKTKEFVTQLVNIIPSTPNKKNIDAKFGIKKKYEKK